MTISAVQRVESVSQVFSLDASAITIGPGASNGAVTGGQILTISGDGFGYGSEGNRNAASAKASVGHSNCMFTRWISDSSLLCKLPAGSYCAVGPVVVTASVQLGSFTASFSYDPPTLAAISAGGTMPSGSGTSLGISCVRYTGRHAKCWGNNGFGQLGQGNTNSLGNAANTMGDNFDVISLGSGRTITEMQTGCGGARKHVCVIMDNGQAKCWGGNEAGQLGQGNTDDIGDSSNEVSGLSAVSVAGATTTTVSKIAVGGKHVCVILSDTSVAANDNTVKCWGANSAGQLGYEDTDNKGDGANEMGDNLGAVNLGSGRTATKICAGDAHSCA